MLFVYLYSAFRHIFVDVAIDMQLNVVGRECFSETRYRGLKMALQRRGSKSRINQSIISMLIFFWSPFITCAVHNVVPRTKVIPRNYTLIV